MLILTITILISSIMVVIQIAFGFTFVVVPLASDVHFGLITVNSIFAGFLFTNYSLLIDFISSEHADKLDGTSILTKRNRHIKEGILCALISIVCGLFLVIDFSDFLDTFAKSHLPWLQNAAFCFELIFSVSSITIFALSMHEMHMLTKPYFDHLEKVNKEKIESMKKGLQKMRDALDDESLT